MIAGVPPWDGRYEYDIEQAPWTIREWGWIKRLSGYLPETLAEGWRGQDPELFAVFAVIALNRAGKISRDETGEVYERLLDTPADARIRIEVDEQAEERDDAGPPAEKTSSSGGGSGGGSRTSSETSRTIPPASGIPASATSESQPLRSVI